MLRPLRHLYLRVYDAALAAYARNARTGPFIRERLATSDPLRASTRAAVYIHFDPNGIVHDYALHQLRELIAAGFRVTFVSNAPVLPEESKQRVAAFCKEIIWRHNVGYDVGGYKDSIATIENLKLLECLILMNDSVYGPFTDLNSVLAAANRSACDFWGITEAYERRRHLQGFFLVFFSKAFLSPTFARFWNELPYVNNKWWIVRNAEVELTHTLEQAGLRSGVLAPYKALVDIARTRMAEIDRERSSHASTPALETFRAKVTGDAPLNPMQYFWDILIERFDSPFIKRDLLLKSPDRRLFLDRWREVIAVKSDYDVTMIDRHLSYLRSLKDHDRAGSDSFE